MGENIFEKFNSMFDIEGLKKDTEEAAASSGDFVEVPDGSYEVKVKKLELGVTGEKSKNPGMPKLTAWLEVLTGDYKGQLIFVNQGLTTGFGLHKAKEFLNSLESGLAIDFENFVQFGALIEDVFKAIDGKGEYELSHTHNAKGFAVDTIVQRFTEQN